MPARLCPERHAGFDFDVKCDQRECVKHEGHLFERCAESPGLLGWMCDVCFDVKAHGF